MRALLVLLVGLIASSIRILAQSDTTFALRELSSQYDATGYLTGSTPIQVDGKLIVSEGSGSVIYRYPISSFTKHGYPISVELNYCGSVNHTTFSKYTTFGNVPGFGDTKQAWGRFDQNRPLWLLSVNGMAVQSLSMTTAFHARPDLVTGAFDKNVSTRTTFSDADIPWCIDGLDYSNRMKSLSMGIDNEARNAYDYVDVIRLLKGDGSVLELRNSHAARSAGLNVSYFNDSLFTGYYHTNSANDPTYAFVELDSSQRPPFFIGSFQYLHVIQPRKLHLFKGDGTEMVYVEHIIPYGTRDYMAVTEPYGGQLAGPTVFYLEEVNSNAGPLLAFKRSRHSYDGAWIPLDMAGIYEYPRDSTRGRALLMEFDGHKITYDRCSISIQALGRTTNVLIGTVVGSGGASETSGVPFPKLGYPARLALDQAALGLASSQNYQSWTGYVTAIVDPEGRSTTFEYEQVLRRYLNSGFPYMPGTGTVQFNLRNLRLKTVTEPTTRYVITYNAAKPSPETGDFGETDWIPIKSKAYGLSETKEPWILNDQVRKVEKYDCSGLLLTDDYTFTGQGGTITSSTHWTTDARDSSVRARRWVYKFDNLPDVLPSLPRGRNTRVVETADSCAGFVKLTRTTYDTLTPWIILPKLTTESINGIDKTRIRHEYTIGAARSFGGDTSLANAYGKDITQRSERAECACDTATANALHPGAQTTVVLEHLPEAIASGAASFGSYDEAATKRRYDSLYSGDANPPDWDAVKFSPLVAVYHTTSTDTVIAPPVSGLETERTVSGGSTFFRTLREYTASNYVDTTHVPRGFLNTVKITGQSGKLWTSNRLTGSNDYTYTAGRWLSTASTDGLGARSERVWSFTPHAGRVLTDRDVLTGDTVAGNEYFPTFFERPSVERMLVRKPTSSGTVRTDTLTTISDRTFYGLASRIIDPNGWTSGYTFDNNGRLLSARLPLDFPARATVDTFTVSGFKSSNIYGTSVDTTWRDTMICKPNPSRAPVVPSWELNRRSSVLVIDNPPVITADCDNCVGIYGKTTGKGGDHSTTLATCTELPWLYHTPSIVYLSAGIRPPGITAITTLDSAWVDLLVTREFDGCMNAIVEIPQFNFSRTYVFGCPPPSGSGSIANGGAPSGAFALLADECDKALTALDSAGPVKRWRINLTNLRDSLKAAGNRGALLTVKIRTSTSGASMELSSDIFADFRPRLTLKGSFSSYTADSGATLVYSYDNDHLKTTTEAKVDDSRHTANRLSSGGSTFQARTTRKSYAFGGDYRVRKTSVPIGDWASPTRIDSAVNVHNGIGTVTSAADADGDVIQTKFDALGRPVEITNADGTKQRFAYFYGTDTSFGLPPMKSAVRIDCLDLFAASAPCDTSYVYACPFVSATRITDETGVKTWRYFDSYDRLRREVVDSGGSGHLNLTTLYDYDELGRMTGVVNDAGDTIRYVYDPLGRLRFAAHPDLGVVSYGYDRNDRVRFSQSQEQADSGRVTFTEYDDLSRPTLIGEATISGSGGGITDRGGSGDRSGAGNGAGNGSASSAAAPPRETGRQETGRRETGRRETSTGEAGKRAVRSALMHVVDSAGFARLTDSLDGDQIYTGLSGSSTPTVNPSIYLTPTGPVPPAVPPLSQFDSVTCPLPKNLMLGETELPVGPFIKHPVAYYEPVTTPAAPRSEFENTAKYPHFVRQVMCYDTFPDRSGAVWSTIPTRGRWDSLAPTGKLRNLKGHEVAIAYREHGGEPYHYTVLSFDERGRPEMLARWTENIGFDVVYYTYNSANDVVTTRAADAFRQFAIWYGSTPNGYTDSVWTELGAPGSGLGMVAPRYPAPIRAAGHGRHRLRVPQGGTDRPDHLPARLDADRLRLRQTEVDRHDCRLQARHDADADLLGDPWS